MKDVGRENLESSTVRQGTLIIAHDHSHKMIEPKRRRDGILDAQIPISPSVTSIVQTGQQNSPATSSENRGSCMTIIYDGDSSGSVC